MYMPSFKRDLLSFESPDSIMRLISKHRNFIETKHYHDFADGYIKIYYYRYENGKKYRYNIIIDDDDINFVASLKKAYRTINSLR